MLRWVLLRRIRAGSPSPVLFIYPCVEKWYCQEPRWMYCRDVESKRPQQGGLPVHLLIPSPLELASQSRGHESYLSMPLNVSLSFPMCALSRARTYVCWNGTECLGHAREVLGHWVTSLALNMLMELMECLSYNLFELFPFSTSRNKCQLLIGIISKADKYGLCIDIF